MKLTSVSLADLATFYFKLLFQLFADENMMKNRYRAITILTLATTVTLSLPNTPVLAFTLTQNNNSSQLLEQLLSDTTGLSNFSVNLVGDARAFGIFEDDPFSLGSGLVLSTGSVENLSQPNISDGGFSPGSSTPLDFTRLNGLTGNPSSMRTAIFRADLATLGFDLNSILVGDSGSGVGGSGGIFSGFDLDAIKISNILVDSAEEVNALAGLDIFNFSPVGTSLTPGTQRPSITQLDLKGTVNGNIDNAVATLEQFDSTGITQDLPNIPFGATSLGDNGQVGFDLTSTLSTSGDPLYLYIGEAGATDDMTETPSGNITVSNRSISELSDLSTDFGSQGVSNDKISIEIEFDADETAENLFFQFVFGSEEFAEFGGNEFNDRFSLKLNGFDFARLSDGSTVSINTLVPSPFNLDNPDFIYNPVDTGPASGQTKLDGYTVPLTYAGLLNPNARNTLIVEIEDVRDGLLDSAVFVKSGTFGTVDPDRNTSVPEPTSGLGILVFGVLSAIFRKKASRPK